MSETSQGLSVKDSEKISKVLGAKKIDLAEANKELMKLGLGNGTLDKILSRGVKKVQFAFIAQGVGAIGFNPMLATYSKYDAIIDKVYIMRKKAYFRAKMDGAGSAKNIVVDIEGAIDNKELLLQ